VAYGVTQGYETEKGKSVMTNWGRTGPTYLTAMEPEFGRRGIISTVRFDLEQLEFEIMDPVLRLKRSGREFD
jgi:hypothetical protein